MKANALDRLRLEAAIGNELGMVLYTIEKALAEPMLVNAWPNWYACDMADESVKMFTIRLVRAHRAAGYLDVYTREYHLMTRHAQDVYDRAVDDLGAADVDPMIVDLLLDNMSITSAEARDLARQITRRK